MTNNDLIFGKNNLGNSGEIVLPVRDNNGIVVEPSEYLHWLDYANCNDVLKKEELELLRKEYDVKKIIEKYERKEMLSEEERYLMLRYLKMFPIPRLAAIKLPYDQFWLCKSRVDAIWDNIKSSAVYPGGVRSELQKSIKMFSASSSITDRYVRYLLRILAANFDYNFRMQFKKCDSGHFRDNNGIVVEPSEYLHWLDYANCNDVLKKEELELLRKEYDVKEIIEKYARKEMLSEEEWYLMLRYLKMFPIPRLAAIKLPYDQFLLCKSRVDAIWNNIESSAVYPGGVRSELQKSIQMFSASSSITDRYVRYLLRILVARLRMRFKKCDSGHSLVKKK